MKTRSIILSVILFPLFSLTQDLEPDFRKTYYLLQNLQLEACNEVGEPVILTNGAQATAVIANGVVTGITFSNGGKGYIVAPQVTIEGDGTGAKAVTSINEGVIGAISVINGGSGYTTASVKISQQKRVNAFRNFEFKVVKLTDNGMVIYFSLWDTGKRRTNEKSYNNIKKTEAEKNNTTYRGSTSNSRPEYYYLLPISSFSASYISEVTPRWSFMLGTVTMPIKMRFGEKVEIAGQLKKKYFDFEGSINVGLNAGASLNINKRKSVRKDFINILTGISLTSVPVDEFTTKGYLTEKTNNAAVTWNTTFMYQRDNFQAGLFFGIDYMAGELGRQWIYRNNLWMGIGIGFSIVKTKSTEDIQ